jgi:hypothetical protein
MTSQEFVIWMKGFMEACNDFTATPKQWDRIKEVLYEVDDNELELDYEEESLIPGYLSGSTPVTQSCSPTITFTSGSSNMHITATVWNDQQGNWHYTNYPEGFGYYERPDNKKQKQQLND